MKLRVSIDTEGGETTFVDENGREAFRLQVLDFERFHNFGQMGSIIDAIEKLDWEPKSAQELTSGDSVDEQLNNRAGW